MNLLSHILSGNEIANTPHEQALKKIGWHITNNGDYLDLEAQASYRQSETEDWDFDSFNLAATFSLQDNILYFVFGNNLGGGMNEKFQFRYSSEVSLSSAFGNAKAQCDDEEFLALMDANTESVDDILTQLEQLNSFLLSPIQG